MPNYTAGERIDATVHGGGWQHGTVEETGAAGGLLRVRLDDGREVWLSPLHVRLAARGETPPTTPGATASASASDAGTQPAS